MKETTETAPIYEFILIATALFVLVVFILLIEPTIKDFIEFGVILVIGIMSIFYFENKDKRKR